MKLGLALVMLAASLATRPVEAASVLATSDQKEVVVLAERIVKTPVVLRQMQRVKEYLTGTQWGRSPEDLLDLDRYVRELAYHDALLVADSDPARPKFVWTLFPGSRAGLDNPDNAYRWMPLSSKFRYRISGRRGTSDHISFQIFDTGPLDGHLSHVTGTLSSENLEVAPDGSFTIEFGSEPTGHQSNYLQIPAASAWLVVRDTMADWSEQPMALQVSMTGGAGTPAPNLDALAAKTESVLMTTAKLWVEVTEKYNYDKPVNTLHMNPTGNGGLSGQYVASSHFALKEGQALVIRARKGSARYMGFELGSNWYISYDYWNRTSSLTNQQAIPNPDGSYTFIVALKDPGVANWLDPVGHHTGLILMRWQGLTQPLSQEDAPVVQLVELADLAKALSPSMPMASPADRRHALSLRLKQVEARGSGQQLGRSP